MLQGATCCFSDARKAKSRQRNDAVTASSSHARFPEGARERYRGMVNGALTISIKLFACQQRLKADHHRKPVIATVGYQRKQSIRALTGAQSPPKPDKVSCDCEDQCRRYRPAMISRIVYDVYRGTTDLRCALRRCRMLDRGAHVKRKDWVLMPRGKSPLHSDVDRD